MLFSKFAYNTLNAYILFVNKMTTFNFKEHWEMSLFQVPMCHFKIQSLISKEVRRNGYQETFAVFAITSVCEHFVGVFNKHFI